MYNDFQSLIHTALSEAITLKPTSFSDLLENMPGVWPALVLQHLQEISKAGHVQYELAMSLATDAIKSNRLFYPPRDRFAQILPVEHPLDFEWRFSPAAIERIWQEYDGKEAHISKGSTPIGIADSDIVLLGVPSLLWSAHCRGIDSRCVLLDFNPAIIQWFSQQNIVNTFRCDLSTDSAPYFNASFVVLDPPWYMDYYLNFLWSARKCCKVGSKIVASLPPVGTRPGIIMERAHLLEQLPALGLEVETIVAGALPYQAPFFEANALRKAGLIGTSLHWRKGDMLTLRVVGRSTMPYKELLPPKTWLEASVGETRWRVEIGLSEAVLGLANGNGNVSGISLESLVEGDILQTVSNRDAHRRRANVWTSGNRIFKCGQPNHLIKVLQNITANGQKGLDTSGFILSSVDQEFVLHTAQLETQEMHEIGYL